MVLGIALGNLKTQLLFGHMIKGKKTVVEAYKDCFKQYYDLVIVCHLIRLGVWKVSLLK